MALAEIKESREGGVVLGFMGGRGIVSILWESVSKSSVICISERRTY